MFQIKTDIRQFNCETQDKVERLIRNWVIRPTDLVYLQESKRWEPIGEHPSFEPLFASLRQADMEGKQSDMASESAEYDLEEIVQSVDAGVLPLPQAPEGVEPPAHDGEVTTMTERTAQLLGMDEDEVEPRTTSTPASSTQTTSTTSTPAPSPSVVVELPSGRHNLPEELFLTNEVDREEIDLAAEEARLDELGEFEGLPTASELDAGWDALMDMDDLRRTGEFDRDGSLPGATPAKREEITKVTAMDGVLEEDRDRGPRSPSPTVEVDSSLGHESTAPADDAAESARVATVAPAPDEPDEPEEKANRTGMINVSDLLKVREAAAPSAAGDADASKEIAAVVKTARVRVANPNQDREFVSEGYALPIPVAIELDDRDLSLGLAFSAADESEKDARFPKPYPKKLKELLYVEFDLARPPQLPSRSTPPPSASAQAVAARAAYAAQPASAHSDYEESPAPSSSPDRTRFILAALAVLGILLLLTILVITSTTP
jgi:hypothetical protein